MKILRKHQVLELLGICSTTLFNWTKSGMVPKPFKLGVRISAWVESDIIHTIKLYKSGMSTEQIQHEISIINANNCPPKIQTKNSPHATEQKSQSKVTSETSCR